MSWPYFPFDSHKNKKYQNKSVQHNNNEIITREKLIRKSRECTAQSNSQFTITYTGLLFVRATRRLENEKVNKHFRETRKQGVIQFSSWLFYSFLLLTIHKMGIALFACSYATLCINYILYMYHVSYVKSIVDWTYWSNILFYVFVRHTYSIQVTRTGIHGMELYHTSSQGLQIPFVQMWVKFEEWDWHPFSSHRKNTTQVEEAPS